MSVTMRRIARDLALEKERREREIMSDALQAVIEQEVRCPRCKPNVSRGANQWLCLDCGHEWACDKEGR